MPTYQRMEAHRYGTSAQFIDKKRGRRHSGNENGKDKECCGQIRLNKNQMKEKLLSLIQVQCNMADDSIEQIQVEQNEEAKALEQVRWNHRKAGKELEE